MITEADMGHLRRCVELASEAVEAGDQPFGSVLVAANGTVLREERNHVGGGDQTQHPELALAQWAVTNLHPKERRRCSVYTSGEHCPMCAAAHGWVGLGRIVYATSSAQLEEWLSEMGLGASPVRCLPIGDIVPDLATEGPIAAFGAELRALHRRCHLGRSGRSGRTGIR